MFDQPDSSPKKTITFAKVAVALAVTAGISFGLCTVSMLTVASGNRRGVNIAPLFGGLVVVCLLGLVVLGIVFVIKSIIESSRRPKDE